MSECDAEPASPTGRRPDLVDEANRLLLERIRLGLWLVLIGVAAVFIAEIALRGTQRPLVSLFQGLNAAAVALALAVLSHPARRTLTLCIAFGAWLATVAATGAVGIAAQDATTPVVLLIGLTLASAMLVPWSPWWQLLAVLSVIGTAVWTVANVLPAEHIFWIQYIGTLSPTLFGSVAISYALQRQRLALVHAEQERRAREDGLRYANRRLEREIDEHRGTEAALRFAMRELDHRVKNTLATVQSVADHTLQSSETLRQFGEAFTGRIQAMARIHSALAGRRWEGLDLDELIELVVGPDRHDSDSIAIACVGTFLPADLVRVLGMALHELATNAAKYGALSTKAGRVAISSRIDAVSPRRLHIDWTERAGPPIARPARRGFGMRLIEEALAYEAGASVAVQFAVHGVYAQIHIPLPAAAR